MASCCVQIRIELGNFYFAKSLRDNARQTWLQNVERLGKDIFFSRYRCRNSRQTRSIRSRHVRANISPRVTAYSILLFGVKFQKTRRGAALSRERRSVGFRESATSLGVASYRIASSPNYWPLAPWRFRFLWRLLSREQPISCLKSHFSHEATKLLPQFIIVTSPSRSGSKATPPVNLITQLIAFFQV